MSKMLLIAPRRACRARSHPGRLPAGGLRLQASALAVLLLLTACASTAPGSAPAAPAAVPGMAAASAAMPGRPASGAAAAVRPPVAASGPLLTPPPPGQPPSFAAVIKDTKKTDGLFAAWQKDDKVWLELQPADFDKPFFLSPKLAGGIGEAGLLGGLMSGAVPLLVQFHRLYNQVQLVAINPAQVARAGLPVARAVAASSSVSLLGSTAVASQPHPDRKSVLVDGNALFLGDMLGLAGQLQRTYRQGYGFDARNSSFSQVRGKPDLLVLEVNGHYATGSLAVPQPGTPPGVPLPSLPGGVPDPRSLFLKVHYSLARLPEVAMARRAADPRIGHFVSVTDDFSDDLARSPRLRYVNRWRLEKKDPAAELSPPLKPITFWLDRNIPEAYRATIAAGVLAWNTAFERLGFDHAIEVKQQADDADFDTLDADVASIRWMASRQAGFVAIGPSHVDPRSGEILDADIAIEALPTRGQRTLHGLLGLPAAAGRSPAASGDDWAQLLQVAAPPDAAAGAAAGAAAQHCAFGAVAAEQLGYALALGEALDDADPASPAAQQFVLDFLKETVMHEVGHALGLRHNFRASHAYTDKQLSDPVFARDVGLAGSVMDYPAVNLPRPGEPALPAFQGSLGPYDLWAIEYAYKVLPAEQEKAGLQRIAERSAEPALAFGTDEDNFLGLDPEVLMFDLGDDPVVFAQRRFDIADALLKRQEGRALKPDEDYAGLRRTLGLALRDSARAAGVLLRQIGGLRTLRDFPNTGREPLQPVAAADQRAALDLLLRHVLSAQAFAISPLLQRRLAPDYFERAESPGATPTDFSLAQGVLGLQRELLGQLMSDGLANRVLDAQAKFSRPDQAFALTELHARLEAEVWRELAGLPQPPQAGRHGRQVATADAGAASRPDIPMARRELQREHINRLAALLLRPGTLTRADARGLLRRQALALASRLETAARASGLSDAARLHLKDSAESLRSALAAKMERTGA